MLSRAARRRTADNFLSCLLRRRRVVALSVHLVHCFLLGINHPPVLPHSAKRVATFCTFSYFLLKLKHIFGRAAFATLALLGFLLSPLKESLPGEYSLPRAPTPPPPEPPPHHQPPPHPASFLELARDVACADQQPQPGPTAISLFSPSSSHHPAAHPPCHPSRPRPRAPCRSHRSPQSIPQQWPLLNPTLQLAPRQCPPLKYIYMYIKMSHVVIIYMHINPTLQLAHYIHIYILYI